MNNKYNILIAIILFVLFGFLSKILTEGFYDPTKPDQRPFELEDHSYDGDLFQSEKILYDMINNLETNKPNVKDHLSELLNILQFI